MVRARSATGTWRSCATGPAARVRRVPPGPGAAEAVPHRGGARRLCSCLARADYAPIVKVADRLPEENVLQEDPDFLMYYDNASLRTAR